MLLSGFSGTVFFRTMVTATPSWPYVENHCKLRTRCVFGAVLDHRFSWLPHLRNVNVWCQQAYNILHDLTPILGCGSNDHAVRLYRALICSCLDLAAVVYEAVGYHASCRDLSVPIILAQSIVCAWKAKSERKGSRKLHPWDLADGIFCCCFTTYQGLLISTPLSLHPRILCLELVLSRRLTSPCLSWLISQHLPSLSGLSPGVHRRLCRPWVGSFGFGFGSSLCKFAELALFIFVCHLPVDCPVYSLVCTLWKLLSNLCTILILSRCSRFCSWQAIWTFSSSRISGTGILGPQYFSILGRIASLPNFSGSEFSLLTS